MTAEKLEFAQRLRRLRTEAGLKQVEVARVIGIGRSAYCYYELGKTEPGIAALKKIAKAFSVSVGTLIGEDA